MHTRLVGRTRASAWHAAPTGGSGRSISSALPLWSVPIGVRRRHAPREPMADSVVDLAVPESFDNGARRRVEPLSGVIRRPDSRCVPD
jgi:hypothetical protein